MIIGILLIMFAWAVDMPLWLSITTTVCAGLLLFDKILGLIVKFLCVHYGDE